MLAATGGRSHAFGRCETTSITWSNLRRQDPRPGSPQSPKSATLAVDAKAKALKAAGGLVIGFVLVIRTSTATTSSRPHSAPAPSRASTSTRLPPGCPSCLEAIGGKSARVLGLAISASQVLVTNGGKHAVFQAFATLLDPGDEVLLPTPYWTFVPESISLAGGVPVLGAHRRTSGHRETVDQLQAHVTDRTKVVLFVSPSNPTGAVYPPEQVA